MTANESPQNSGVFRCSLVLLTVAFMSGLVEPLSALLRRLPLNPNEGWNAFLADAAMRGDNLYSAPGHAIINNYPPVSFYVIGSIGRVMADNIVAGRVVALISMAVVILNVYLWLLAAGSNRRIAGLGAGMTAVYAVTFARSYTAIDDPQWLAHALMSTGMVVIWRGKASSRSILLGALIMVVAAFTKHLLIAIPIAITWWLMRRSRLELQTWLFSSGVLLAIALLLSGSLFGMAFFDSLLSAREYSLAQMGSATLHAVKYFAPPLLVSMTLPWAKHGERVEFAVAYLLSATVAAVVASGGIGVNINAFFDVMIAANLCAALAVEHLSERQVRLGAVRTDLGSPAMLVLSVCLASSAAILFPVALRQRSENVVLERDTSTVLGAIAATGQRRVACEMPAVCYWAKSEFIVDFFNYGQRLKVGKTPTISCARVFDGSRVALVQLNSQKDLGSPMLPRACNTVIEQNYRPVSISHVGTLMESVLH